MKKYQFYLFLGLLIIIISLQVIQISNIHLTGHLISITSSNISDDIDSIKNELAPEKSYDDVFKSPQATLEQLNSEDDCLDKTDLDVINERITNACIYGY